MDQKRFEQILAGEASDETLPSAAQENRSYLKQSGLKDIVALSESERAADRATNAIPAVQDDLRREFDRAKDPKIKEELRKEMERQGLTAGSKPYAEDDLASEFRRITASGAENKQSQEPDYATGVWEPERAGSFGQNYEEKVAREKGPSIGDYGRAFTGSAVRGFGDMAQGLVGEPLAWLANTITGTSDYEGKNVLKGYADQLKEGMTLGGKLASQDTPSGDAFDHSTWKLPDTTAGMLMLGADSLGSLIPSIVPFIGQAGKVQKLTAAAAEAKKAAEAFHAAGNVAKAAEAVAKAKELAGLAAKASSNAKIVGAVSGGAMTGGAAAGEIREELGRKMDGMSHEQLLETVPAYRAAFEQSGDQRAARNMVVDSAAQWGGVLSGAMGAVGGAFNAKILEDVLVKKGVASALGGLSNKAAVRGAVGFGAGAVAEGLQEGSEKVGQNVGENIGRGDDAMKNVGRDAFADMLGGALVGGVMGTGGGALSPHTTKPAQQPPVQQPNSPLSNAAGLADHVAQQQAAAADPFAPAIAQISERFDDRSLFSAIRENPGLGPDALSDILASYRIATNTNIEPSQRQAAIDRLSMFFSAYDNQPNFAFGSATQEAGLPVVVGGQQTEVGPVNPTSGAIDGQATRVDDPLALGEQRRLPAPPERLASPPPALIADNREAQRVVAEYEAAYQDLVKADQLGASDQELMQRQVNLRNAEARLQELNQTIESGMANESAQKRNALLDAVLASNPQNPLRAFDRALRLDGFNDLNFSDAEKAKIQRFNELRQMQGEQESVVPNEAGDFGIPERKDSPQQGKFQEVANLLNSGWKLEGKQLVSPAGQRRNLKAGELQYVRNKLNSKKPVAPKTGETNVAEPAQMAEEAPQANDAQVGPEQAAAPTAEGRTDSGVQGQQGVEPTIEELQAELEAAPFGEKTELNDILIERVTAEIESLLDSGVIPVYGMGQGTFLAVHPSAQNEGMIQVTRYSERGVFGDSQYNNVRDAVRDNGLWFKKRMPQAEADSAMADALAAESEFQAKKDELERNKKLWPESRWFSTKEKAEEYLRSYGYSRGDGDYRRDKGPAPVPGPIATIEEGSVGQGGFNVILSEFTGDVEDKLKRAAELAGNKLIEARNAYKMLIHRMVNGDQGAYKGDYEGAVASANRTLDSTIKSHEEEKANLEAEASKPQETDEERVARIRATAPMERAQEDLDWYRERARSNAQAEESAAAEAEKLRKEAEKSDNMGGFLDGLPANRQALIRKALEKKANYNGKVQTLREWIEDRQKDGSLSVSTEQEDKIKPMSRMAYFRADNKQQAEHERKVKEGGKVTVYYINDYVSTKTAYDYASFLLGNAGYSASEQNTAQQDNVQDKTADKPSVDTVTEPEQSEASQEAKTNSYSDIENKLINGEINVEEFMAATGLTDEDVGFLTSNDLNQKADNAAKEESPYFAAIKKLSAAIFKEMEGLSRGSTAPSRRAYDANLAKYKAAQDTLNVIAKNFEHPFRNTLIAKLPPFLESRYGKQWDGIEYGDKAKKAYRKDSYRKWVDLLIEAARNKNAAVDAASQPITDTPVNQPAQAEPAITPESDFERGKAMMGEGMDKLIGLLGGKTNMLPEEEAQIIPIMSQIFRGAALMGYAKFKEASRFVLDTLRSKAPDVADKIDIDNLQAGYINAMKSIPEASSKAEIIAFDSIEQLFEERDVLNKRIEAAEDRTALNPTDAQKESGNYVKGKFAWNGMTISIETPKGAERSGVGEDGQPWSITAPTSYGYFLGTTAADNEHLDVYIGDKPESDRVYVINQTKVDSTKFDEHKVLAGFDSEEDAKTAYFGAFTDGFADRVFGSISGPYSVEEFKSLLPKMEKASPVKDRITQKSERIVEEEKRKYEETVAKAKAKEAERSIVPLAQITVIRNAEIDGQEVEYDQKADEALAELDKQMTLGKQLLECLAA